jgi:hypothetical protein
MRPDPDDDELAAKRFGYRLGFGAGVLFAGAVGVAVFSYGRGEELAAIVFGLSAAAILLVALVDLVGP